MRNMVILASAIGLAAVATMFQTGVQAKLGAAIEAFNAPKQTVSVFSTMGCGTAMTQLARQGFRDVVASDCTGSKYQFSVNRNGSKYVVVMNAKTGGVTTVSQ